MALIFFGLRLDETCFPQVQKMYSQTRKASLHLKPHTLHSIAKQNFKRENMSEIFDTPP